MGRTVTPGLVMSMSRKEMPCCFFAAGSVRTRQKIQSAYWANVVQVFCPLTTYSSPSRTAEVFSEARSLPASGSENPWHHQMSRFAVGGRNRFFCSSLPKVAITGPTIAALNASGGGTCAAAISSAHRWRWIGVQSWPPHSTGQFGTASACSARMRCVRDESSLLRCSPRAPFSRISAGISVVKNVRIRSAKASSSGLSARSTDPSRLRR